MNRLQTNPTDVEQFFGKINLITILAILPVFFQIWKELTGWEGKKMKWFTIIFCYVIVGPYYLATAFQVNAQPTLPEVIFLCLGFLIYPGLAWALTQGIYSTTMKGKSQSDTIQKLSYTVKVLQSKIEKIITTVGLKAPSSPDKGGKEE